MISLVDTAVPMNEDGFPVARAKHIWMENDKNLQELYDLGELGGEGDAGHIELTQAEYDALPEEEKMNGAIYFITDAIGGGEDISIDDNTISTETTWSSEKIFSELNENYAIFEGTVGESYYSTNISAEDIYSGSSLYGGWTIDKVKSSTEMAMIINKYNAASNKKIINNFYDYLDVQVNEYDIYLEDTAKDNGGKPYKFALLWSNEGGNEDTLIVNCTISAETDENIEIINYDGNYTQIKEAIENGTKVELRVLYNYSTLYILEPSRIDTNGYIYFNSINNTSSVTVSIKEPSIINFDLVDLSSSSEEGIATYTSLAELGLTAPVTVGDIFNAMPDKSMAVIACEDVTEHITDVPMHYGVLTIKKSAVGRFSIDFQNSLASSPCNVKKWIGTLKGDDGTGLYWREVAYKENLSIYKSLSELGLDTTATLKDITRAMEKSSMIAIKVDAMANQSEYNNITQGTVTIYKIEDARIQAIMTEKSTGRTWVGTLGGENTIIGWKELRSDPPFYRIVTQGIWGYFKFKPTSTGKEQPLRISVTDNYGGMINISGATPSGSQYKPFKCIRLSYGEFTDYDAIKVANNKMLKLFYYDGYFYLKVATYTTCTFTGLTEAPTYVETFDEENAEQIPIRSVFDTPYNDGYADPSIIVVGDTDSSDGVIKTLATLGFTSDIMTWDTGVYRLSHISGLTNLPTEITEEKPGLRLEHYDMKKWGSNHNPNLSTYGCRQSVLHYKGDVFVRYTESGATAGVLITDTGWKQIATKTVADVAQTAITRTSDITTNANYPNYYMVKNGICYFSMYFTSTSSGSKSLNLGLPKAAQTTYFTGYRGDGKTAFGCSVDENGAFKVNLDSSTTNAYMLSGSYPVAE